jgi:hypothetical protein
MEVFNFLMKNLIQYAGIFEYRGQSWSIGADEGAVTFFNFFKHYTPTVAGGSLGSHLPEVCLGVDFCPDYQYRPEYDQLNGAQSGSWVLL